jgi:inhibitor of cysteine peptidase
MLKKLSLIIALSILLAPITGCDLLDWLMSGGAGELNLSDADNGRTIQLSVGQTVTISLEANASTGYTWEIKDLNQSIVQQVGQMEYKAGSQMPGAPGTATFRFRAMSPGQTTLTLIYHRPWEQNVPPAKTFSIQVAVS